jgi:nucleoside-diphosphate-sugar epimerase
VQICITGANGFIGRQLVDSLSNKGHLVRILTRHNRTIFPANIEVIIGDLTNSNCPLSQFMNGCEVLFHCAGEIRDVNSMRLLHVDGTQQLIQSAFDEYSRSKRKIHWVQLSSCGVYGPPVGKPEIDRVVTETSPSRPFNCYESTKAMSDELVIQAGKSGSLTFSILRPANVFGAKMTNQSLLRLITLVKRRYFFYVGKIGAVANYVHVNDVVAALLMLATNARAKGEIYNLSYDCTIEELINYTASLLHVGKPRIRIPRPLIRIPIGMLSALLNRWVHIPKLDALFLRTRYPTNKIESELGFIFTMPLPNAIEEMTKIVA